MSADEKRFKEVWAIYGAIPGTDKLTKLDFRAGWTAALDWAQKREQKRKINAAAKARPDQL